MRLGASPHIPTLPLRWGASLSSDFFLILHTCHLCPEFGVLARSEALRQQIRDLVVCRYISQFNGFFFDFVSEPVVLDVEVLGSFCQTRVGCDFDTGLRVLVGRDTCGWRRLPEFR